MVDAIKTQIAIGSLEFDGYMLAGVVDEEGLPVFGFSMTQAGVVTGLTEDPRQAAKRIIQIFTSKEAQTRFPKGLVNHQNCKIKDGAAKGIRTNILTIESFSKLLRLVSNPKADVLADALTGYSLRKIFSRSFNVQFTDEDAEAWIAARFVGIEKRNAWTDGIKAWVERSDATDNQKKFVYMNVSDRLNLAMTGHKAKYWNEKLGCDTSTLRSQWNSRHLHEVEALETIALKFLEKQGGTPLEALETAIEFLDIKANPNPLKEGYKEPFDNKVYMRRYMRERRAKLAAVPDQG